MGQSVTSFCTPILGMFCFNNDSINSPPPPFMYVYMYWHSTRTLSIQYWNYYIDLLLKILTHLGVVTCFFSTVLRVYWLIWYSKIKYKVCTVNNISFVNIVSIVLKLLELCLSSLGIVNMPARVDFDARKKSKIMWWLIEMWLLIEMWVLIEMWWLIGSAPDFGPGFESSISHNNPGAQQDHCVIL